MRDSGITNLADSPISNWVIFVASVPLLYMLIFLITSIFPSLSRSIKDFYKKYPDLDEIMSHVDNAQISGSPLFYLELPLTVTEDFLIWEQPKDPNIVRINDIQYYRLPNTRSHMLEITNMQGQTRSLLFPSLEGMLAAEGAIRASLEKR